MVIDIIIPTIPERERYLERCLRTINNVELPQGIQHNIIVINEKSSAGKQRNIGLSQSTGDYFYFIDDDDLMIDGFYCHKMVTALNRKDPAVFFRSHRYFQPSETDLDTFRYDNCFWAIGRNYMNYHQLHNKINSQFNPYPVGSYILRKDMKKIKWPEEFMFGEDIIYNSNITKELCKIAPSLSYIDDMKHIVIRHQKSTTYATPERRMDHWLINGTK
jgi:glycosyltransferase involved in cell wall biosynthesis